MSEGPKGLDWKAFTPEDSPKTPMDLSADPILQDLSTPNLTVGETAFDLIDSSGMRTLKYVRRVSMLITFRNR